MSALAGMTGLGYLLGALDAEHTPDSSWPERRGQRLQTLGVRAGGIRPAR